MSGNEDDWERDARRGEVALKIESTSLWQPDVEDKTGRAIGWVRSDKIINGRKQPWVQAGCPQKPSERFAKSLVIIDNDHAGM